MAKPQCKWTLLAAGLLALSLVYGFYGRAYIETLYEGGGPAVLQQRVMKHKEKYSLSHYRHRADMTVVRVLTAILFYSMLGTWILNGAGFTDVRRMFFLLLLGDGVLFQTHFLFLSNDWFDVGTDWGIPQIYQYLKEIVGATLFFIIYRRGKNPFYLTLGCLMAFMFLDDAFQYHEAVGLWLSAHFDLSGLSHVLGCDAKSVGELLSLAPYFVVFLPLLTIRILRSARESRQAPICFVLLLAATFFFGAGIDLMAEMDALKPLSHDLNVLENTGTMILMSCIVAYTAFCLRRTSEKLNA